MIVNDNLKTQLSSAQDSDFGLLQASKLHRTTDGDSRKFRNGGIYNSRHGHQLDYPNGESVHKVEYKQNYVENSTLPFATEYVQKRSVNMSMVDSALTIDSQKLLVGRSVNRESDSVNKKCLHNSKKGKCRTKRPWIKISSNLKGDSRTRMRRSDEKKENHNSDMNNKQSVENRDAHTNTSVIQNVHSSTTPHNHVDNQTHLSDTNESPVVYPQYFVYTWVLCMVALASFLKLNYLVKTIVLVFMVTCYSILIIQFRSEISQCCG